MGSSSSDLDVVEVPKRECFVVAIAWGGVTVSSVGCDERGCCLYQ